MQNDVTVLNDYNWWYRSARVLQVANRLDVFTVLSEGRLSAQQIAQRCRSKPEMTDRLLIACTAMGLLKKQGRLYANSELAQTYLVLGRRLYQGDIIAHSASKCSFWDSLADEIMADDASAAAGKADERRDFIMGMHNIAVAGRAQMFIDAVDLSGHTKLFDVGGGPGTYSIAACKHYPQLRAVVFDLPQTVSIAKEIIAKEAMQDRVTVQEGNWNSDGFGHNNDVVLLSDVMHGPGSKAPMILKKAYDSMVDGGLLVVQEFLLNNEKTGPLIAALFNMMVGAYSKAELLALVEEAGFSGAKVVSNCEKSGSGWITAAKP